MPMYSALGVSAISFLLVTAFTPILIWGLRTLHLTQPIRAELPSDQQAKRGTPLMAGLILLSGAVISIVTMQQPLVYLLTSAFFLFSLIGFLDDYKKAAYQDPSGISGKTKLLLQFLTAAGLLFVLIWRFSLSTDIAYYHGLQLHLPAYLYVTAVLLFIVASANAINFTDGMDGLLIVTAIPVYFFFFAITGNVEVQLFCLVMIACLLGLLIYNIYPAKAFMGDTGSLAIGGSLAVLAVVEKVELLAPLLFLVFFAEQLSVILQVWYYKRTRNRIFKMAPIHYHFHLKYGWSENRIVITFGMISWGCALVCWMLWRYVL